MLQNTGAVISIAFVMAVVTAAVPQDVLFKIFSGVAIGPLERAARAVHREHAHGAVGAGRGVARRRRGVAHAAARPPRMSAPARAERLLRIGEVAELTGTTPRTIRYYEEIGLLPEAEDRASGKRRLYTDADVERLQEIVRLRDLLGLSLEQLASLLEAEDARAALRRQWERDPGPRERRRILTESLGHIDGQLALVRERRAQLERLEGELASRRHRVRTRLRTLEADDQRG